MKDLPVRITTLPSGLRVITGEIAHVRSVALGAWIAAGTRDEAPEDAGLAHFLEHMTFKGTRRRSARRIAEEIEDVGGSLDAHTTREYTAYYARVLAEDAPLALDLLADLVQDAVLDPGELAREREVVLQEIAEIADAADEWVFDLAQQTAFPDQGLGWPILGRRETVRGFDADRTRRFLAQCYIAPRTVVAAAGAVDHARFVDEVARLFRTLPGDLGPARQPPRYVGGEAHEEREIDQLHVVLGMAGVGLDDPAFYAQHLFSGILGGGMASRLFQEVREVRGLAYSVFTFVNVFADVAFFGVYAACDPQRAGELVRVMAGETRRLADEGPSEAELRRARRQVEAGIFMSLESPGAVAEDAARQLLYFGRRITPEEVRERIAALGAEDVRAIGRRLLSARPTLAAVGPRGTLPDLTEVEAILRSA